ncbi:MAG: hypothetical protein JO112_04940 [Planctomycetes bacterium]|nr:hypothetical protein [Planctomycetota bacterium]
MNPTHSPSPRIFFFGAGQADGGSEVRHLVGGKGASLADMTRAGLPVPPGFTITTECCRQFFEAGQQWPPGLEAEVRAALTRLEQLLGQSLGQGTDPLLVSVRSGAAESMPGMMDTVLNVGLNPDGVRAMNNRTAWLAYRHFLAMFGQLVAGIDDNVFTGLAQTMLQETRQPSEDHLDPGQLETLCRRFQAAYRQHTGQDMPADPWVQLRAAIEAVFRSWKNERAVAYRQHHHLQGLPGTAVTVQAMCPSEVSGVMFTANPVNPGLPQIIVESAFGLGEAIVLGKVTPDRFVLDKNTLAVLERHISAKEQVIAAATLHAAPSPESASLTDAQLQELARLGLDVENHFQMPCDIEWGLARGRFYLLQARAIKGLEDARLLEQVRRETIDRLRREAGTRPCAWVLYNLAETLPSPTPMTWDLLGRFMTGAGGFGLMYQDLGFQPSARVKQEGFLELICDRIYLNTQRHAELFWSDFPWEYDLDLIKKDPSRAEAMPTRMDSTRAGLSLLFKLPGSWRKMARSRKILDRLKREFDQEFTTNILPPYLEYVRTKQAEDLSHLDDQALLAELSARYRRVLEEFGKEAVKLSYLGSAVHAELSEQLQKLFPADEWSGMAAVLTAGLENDRTVEANLKLMDVARGNLTLEQFLEEFGHRASQEFELSQPRWREDPSFLESMIESFRANPRSDPYKLHQKMQTRREELEKSLPEKLRERKAARSAPGLLELCALVRRYLPYRETAKHYLLMGYALLRQVLLEIDRRRHLEGGVFFLHEKELPELLAGKDFSREIAARRERRRAELRIHVPDLITTEDLEAIGRPAVVEGGGDSLQGIGVASGSGTGPAAVVFDPSKARGLTRGYVLVCPSTDPGWTPLFLQAAALVMERGGVLSHGAVVARDLGIPAVVVKGATTQLTPGEWLRVDGDVGVVSRVKGGERGV